ncbi:hypothetical protein Mapa_012199 [Marchantia paleacea]|nr:hypothetical protein Mapa_012199 [Marchantia paleacea]
MIIPGDEVRGMSMITEELSSDERFVTGTFHHPVIVELSNPKGKGIVDSFDSETEQNQRPCKKSRPTSSAETAEETPLPVEMVEHIVAMMPFPSILTARKLNRSWKSMFSEKSTNARFREIVKSVSSKWGQYCPVILNKEEEWLMGYDRVNHRWQKMALGIARRNYVGLGSPWIAAQKLKGAGSLICGLSLGLFVCNVFTKGWRWLPSRPNDEIPKDLFIVPDGPDAYKILTITLLKPLESGQVCAQLYESKIDSWSMKISNANFSLSFNSSSVYVNGLVYYMQYDVDDDRDVLRLSSYNVNEGTWQTIPHPFACMLHTIETYELLVCQNKAMVVMHLIPLHQVASRGVRRNTLIVFSIDSTSKEIKEESRGPSFTIHDASSTLFASDDESIYFGDPQTEKSSVVVLNVRRREWSFLRRPLCTDGSFKNKWVTFAFQPGMNPFVAV